jgi:hypothetical protein
MSVGHKPDTKRGRVKAQKYWIFLVEAAGIEPASEGTTLTLLRV